MQQSFNRTKSVTVLGQNWPFHFKNETPTYSKWHAHSDLLFRRVAKLVLSSSVITFLHALIAPERSGSYVIVVFEGSNIFGVNLSHGLCMLLNKNRVKCINIKTKVAQKNQVHQFPFAGEAFSERVTSEVIEQKHSICNKQGHKVV